MNSLRHVLADRIEREGGYSRGYHDRWAISYCVGLYYANLDKDHIFDTAVEHHGPLPPLTGLEWDESQTWERAQEMMVSGLNDDDGQRSYGPETAKRYSLPGGLDSIYFKVTFGLAGRCGKHLVVEEFEGVSLNISANQLASDIRGGEHSNVWCRSLLAMMDEWEQMFTSKAASQELEYQAAWLLYQEQTERWEAWRSHLTKARAEHGDNRRKQLQLHFEDA